MHKSTFISEQQLKLLLNQPQTEAQNLAVEARQMTSTELPSQIISSGFFISSKQTANNILQQAQNKIDKITQADKTNQVIVGVASQTYTATYTNYWKPAISKFVTHKVPEPSSLSGLIFVAVFFAIQNLFVKQGLSRITGKFF